MTNSQSWLRRAALVAATSSAAFAVGFSAPTGAHAASDVRTFVMGSDTSNPSSYSGQAVAPWGYGTCQLYTRYASDWYSTASAIQVRWNNYYGLTTPWSPWFRVGDLYSVGTPAANATPWYLEVRRAQSDRGAVVRVQYDGNCHWVY